LRLFISWSGSRSERIAQVFADWIRQTVQAAEPWFSNEIIKGKRWSPEIANALRDSPMGLICLTPENISNPWLLFEAGAISNTKDALVCTFLVGLREVDVEPPLGQFQATPFDRNEVKKLLVTINNCVGDHGGKPLSAATLDKVFEKHWPSLEKDISSIAAEPAAAKQPKRSQEEVLQELLHTVRNIDRRVSELNGPLQQPSGVEQLRRLSLYDRARLVDAASETQVTETPLPLRAFGTAGEIDQALPLKQPTTGLLAPRKGAIPTTRRAGKRR